MQYLRRQGFCFAPHIAGLIEFGLQSGFMLKTQATGLRDTPWPPPACWRGPFLTTPLLLLFQARQAVGYQWGIQTKPAYKPLDTEPFKQQDG